MPNGSSLDLPRKAQRVRSDCREASRRRAFRFYRTGRTQGVDFATDEAIWDRSDYFDALPALEAAGQIIADLRPLTDKVEVLPESRTM